MFNCLFGHKWEVRTQESSPCQTVRVCQRCGKREEIIEHVFGEWKFVAPDSFTQEQTCQRCSHKNTRTHKETSPYPADSEQALQHAKLLREQAIDQRNLGNYGEARHLLRQAIIVHPRNVSSRHLWGRMELDLSNFETARFLFREATNIQMYNPLSWRDWGVLEKKVGNYDEARKLLIKSAKSSFKNSHAWQTWAILEKELGYFNKARRLFRQAVTISTDNYRAWHAWGVMERDLGNYSEAKRSFDTAILANPQNTAPYQTWALLELREGNHDKALELIQKAVELNSNDWNVLIAYSEVQNELGNESDARVELLSAKRLLEDNLQKNPGNTRTLNFLGHVLGNLGEYEEAEKILRISANTSSPHERHYAHNGLGEIHWAQGQYDEAIEEWKKALELSPYYLAARNNLEYIAGLDNFVRETFRVREDDIVDSRFEEMIDQIMHDSKAPYIARLREDRGFGFITQPDKLNEPDIFFHFSNVRNPDAIQVGARVDFDIGDTPKGKAARNVVIL